MYQKNIWFFGTVSKGARHGFPAPFSGRVFLARAALYMRVSTADQSCERQQRDLLAYAERAGYEVVGLWREQASGREDRRPKRREILALAQARRIDVVLVTELSRWGRSTADLVRTLQSLQGWGVSLIAQTGLTFDLGTPQGRLVASLMSALAEFEGDLIRERVCSGLAAARAKGKRLGRRPGERPSERHLARVAKLLEDGLSVRKIARAIPLSATTVQALRRKILEGK